MFFPLINTNRQNMEWKLVMAKIKRGKRDGTGPFSGSYRKRTSKVGRRKAVGVKCPKSKK